MRDRVKVLLQGICADPVLEQRFLHTLSLLEFMGARKIGKSVAAHHPPALVLEHWADETRHAAVLAGLAASGPVDVASVEYLCEEPTKTYFQAVDRGICESIGRGRSGEERGLLNYLVVTSVIERRAMMVYPLYRAHTDRDDVREALSRIIVEEQSHRHSIEEAAEAALDREQLQGLDAHEATETALFDQWLAELEGEVLGLAPQRKDGTPSTTQPAQRLGA